jgi:hypothetical protein
MTESTSNPVPDLGRDVHYALKAEALSWHTTARKPPALCWPMFAALRYFILPGVLLGIYTLGTLLPGPGYVRTGLYVVVAIIILGRLAVRGRREKLENERLRPAFAAHSDQNYRLRAAGQPALLLRLRDAVNAAGDDFEPLIFRVGRAKSAGGRGVRDVLVLVAMFLGVWAALALTTRVFRINAPTIGPLVAYLSMALVFGVWAFAWPTYLRFVPGRLDVIAYPLLGRGRPRVRSFDLTVWRVLVLAPGGAALIHPTEKQLLVLDVGPLPPITGHEPLAFERAILIAARSTHPAPPLPEDELIG